VIDDRTRIVDAGEHEVVRMRGISKSFGVTRALDNVDLSLRPGEVMGLIGENGAGKSTLMKILAGSFAEYSGEIWINGTKTPLHSARLARDAGIVLVHQELSLIPELTVAENIQIGREPGGGIPGFISRRKLNEEAGRHVRTAGFEIDLRSKVANLSVATRQLVEIVKGVASAPRVLIFDEPTSSLSAHEAAKLFRLIAELRAQGTAIVYISHKLDELFAVCDRLTVLRDGRLIATKNVADWNEQSLVSAMVGRPLTDLYPRTINQIGDIALALKGLTGPGFRNVSFELRRGEILGLYGIVGAGRTELGNVLTGLARAVDGTLAISGRATRINSVGDALRQRIALVPEDRHTQGLVLSRSIRSNASLAALRKLSAAGFVKRGAEKRSVAALIDYLRVRLASDRDEVSSLSGGNQQKIVLTRALLTEPQVLVLDEPTRGIDVVAKAEVHASIDRMAAEGMAVLLISSDLSEIIGMSDRVMVMRKGSIVGELSRAESTEERLVSMASGFSHE